MSERDEFEAWHNRFYGPQDKYNPIRSLAHDSCGVGLGYDDPTVQAQFVAFCGALAARDTPPQAVPALTDERRRAAAKALVEVYLGFPAPDREPGNIDLHAVDAVATVLGAAQPSRIEPKEPEHAHDWRFSLQDHVYKCDCGATRGDFPFGPATFKD